MQSIEKKTRVKDQIKIVAEHQFLHQHVMKPTHCRSNQTANMLDIILANEEAMVLKIKLIFRAAG